jgi:hypothetical protein
MENDVKNKKKRAAGMRVQVNYFDNSFKITCQMKMSNEGRQQMRDEEKGRLPKKKTILV